MAIIVAILLAVFVTDGTWDWVVLIAGVLIEIVETSFFVWWSKRKRATVGVDTLVGRRAVVAVDCRPEGQVRIAGEIWHATCSAGAAAGDEVVVRAVKGLMLEVEPA
jgi:membrane protein implicated in regulation of membrane protease activity